MPIERMTFEEYQQLDALSQSSLKQAFRSWKQFEYARRVGWQPKANTIPGSLTHTFVEMLPVERFEAEFTVMPDYARHPDNVTNGRTLKSGEVSGQKPSTSSATNWVAEQEAAFRREHHGHEIVSEKDFNRASRMLQSIEQNEKAMRLIVGSCQEPVVVADINGVLCKGRPDGFWNADAVGVLWDLKTSNDISPHGFGRTAANLRYLFQLAFYWRLLEANGVTVDEVYIIAVQDTVPRKDGGLNDAADCCVYSVPLIAIENQMGTVDRLLSEYRQCEESGVWPGLPDGELVVPNWAMMESGDTVEWEKIK